MQIIRKSTSILLLILLIGIIYKLNIFAILLCLGCGLIFNIFFMKQEKIRHCYLNKFNDVVMYMEQLIYSFKKQPKIRMALEDAAKVCSQRIKEIIEETIINIDSKMESNIYEKSLKIIQHDYNCKRLRSLHDFLIKIEAHWGDDEEYINILL